METKMFTNFKKWQKGLLFILLSGFVGLAAAHHTGAMYDRSITLTLEGTVKKLRFTNPHTWIIITIKDENGELVEWGVEGSAPARFRKFGISPKTVKAGDKVAITVHPLRDGRNGAAFVSMVLGDGTIIDTAKNAAPGYETKEKSNEKATPVAAETTSKTGVSNLAKVEKPSSDVVESSGMINSIVLVVIGLIVLFGLIFLIRRSKK